MSSLRNAALSALLLTACGSWQVQTVSPQRALSNPHFAGSTVRLTNMDNERIVVRDVRLRGDDVVGRDGYSRFTMPLADVREVETRRFSPGRTVGLVAGAAATVGLALLALMATAHDGS